MKFKSVVIVFTLLSTTIAKGSELRSGGSLCDRRLLNTFNLSGLRRSSGEMMQICPTVHETCCSLMDQLNIVTQWRAKSQPQLNRFAGVMTAAYAAVIGQHERLIEISETEMVLHYAVSTWVPYVHRTVSMRASDANGNPQNEWEAFLPGKGPVNKFDPSVASMPLALGRVRRLRDLSALYFYLTLISHQVANNFAAFKKFEKLYNKERFLETIRFTSTKPSIFKQDVGQMKASFVRTAKTIRKKLQNSMKEIQKSFSNPKFAKFMDVINTQYQEKFLGIMESVKSMMEQMTSLKSRPSDAQKLQDMRQEMDNQAFWLQDFLDSTKQKLAHINEWSNYKQEEFAYNELLSGLQKQYDTRRDAEKAAEAAEQLIAVQRLDTLKEDINTDPTSNMASSRPEGYDENDENGSSNHQWPLDIDLDEERTNMPSKALAELQRRRGKVYQKILSTVAPAKIKKSSIFDQIAQKAGQFFGGLFRPPRPRVLAESPALPRRRLKKFGSSPAKPLDLDETPRPRRLSDDSEPWVQQSNRPRSKRNKFFNTSLFVRRKYDKSKAESDHGLGPKKPSKINPKKRRGGIIAKVGRFFNKLRGSRFNPLNWNRGKNLPKKFEMDWNKIGPKPHYSNDYETELDKSIDEIRDEEEQIMSHPIVANDPERTRLVGEYYKELKDINKKLHAEQLYHSHKQFSPETMNRLNRQFQRVRRRYRNWTPPKAFYKDITASRGKIDLQFWKRNVKPFYQKVNSYWKNRPIKFWPFPKEMFTAKTSIIPPAFENNEIIEQLHPRYFHKTFVVLNTSKAHFCLDNHKRLKEFNIEGFRNILPTMILNLRSLLSTKQTLYCNICDATKQRAFNHPRKTIIFEQSFCRANLLKFGDYLKWKNIYLIEYMDMLFQSSTCLNTNGRVWNLPFSSALDKYKRRIPFIKKCFENIDRADFMQDCHFICRQFNYIGLSPFFDGDAKILSTILMFMVNMLRQRKIEGGQVQMLKAIRELDVNSRQFERSTETFQEDRDDFEEQEADIQESEQVQQLIEKFKIKNEMTAEQIVDEVKRDIAIFKNSQRSLLQKKSGSLKPEPNSGSEKDIFETESDLRLKLLKKLSSSRAKPIPKKLSLVDKYLNDSPKISSRKSKEIDESKQGAPKKRKLIQKSEKKSPRISDETPDRKDRKLKPDSRLDKSATDKKKSQRSDEDLSNYEKMEASIKAQLDPRFLESAPKKQKKRASLSKRDRVLAERTIRPETMNSSIPSQIFRRKKEGLQVKNYSPFYTLHHPALNPSKQTELINFNTFDVSGMIAELERRKNPERYSSSSIVEFLLNPKQTINDFNRDIEEVKFKKLFGPEKNENYEQALEFPFDDGTPLPKGQPPGTENLGEPPSFLKPFMENSDDTDFGLLDNIVHG